MGNATSNSLPLVTIAIPTYNRAKGYLKQAIHASLKQTYPHIEVVISNNCSSDNTDEVVGAFDDRRIRYYRQEKNIGANNNFNFLLKKAKGIYFLLLQDDDLIDSDFVETCMKAVSFCSDAGIIQTGTRIIDSKGDLLYEEPNKVSGDTVEDFILGWLAARTSPYLCSTLFNVAVLREVGGFGSKHNLFQDVVAEVMVAAKHGRAGIRDVKASFRKHEGEMTFAAKVGHWCEDSLDLLDLMCKALPAKKDKVRAQGMRFFSKLNYNRARSVKSSWRRIAAYFIVFRKFGYRHLPSKDHILNPLYGCLQRTPVYNGMRLLKRKIRAAYPGS